MTDLLLGVDVGTTWCKAGAVEVGGREHPVQRVATPWRTVPTGAEADPEELAGAALAAVRRALEAAPAGRVVGIGVTGMAEAGVLLDARGTPLAPVIAWHDRRGSKEAERLAAEIPDFSARTGLPASTTCTLVKHAHLARERWLRGSRWLNVPEWVVHRFGGDQVAELSLAARTGYLELAPGRWWNLALRWAQAPPGFLPDPVVAGTRAGQSSLREARGAVLTVAGHDHTCAAYGAGATRPGDVLDSCGTAEALVRAVRPPVPEERVAAAVRHGLNVGWHVVPGLMSIIGGFPSGRLLAGVDVDSPAAEPVLAALAAKTAGVLAAIDAIAGRHRRLVVTGGWARLEPIRRCKAGALGRFEMAATEEAGVLGAARLAGVAAGVDSAQEVRR